MLYASIDSGNVHFGATTYIFAVSSFESYTSNIQHPTIPIEGIGFFLYNN